ncbi:hypothetical protein WA026_013302 [Henosepilachna vigintioctopunctata]|uniref:Inner centromere protein ARK-binding domain-containing protein n=1 Tax=Henosepilachna vigintioctopunctata TaxID=420089 RepID=A0AAW1VCR6_9CUCU
MEELEQFLEKKVEVRANFVERHLEHNDQTFNTFLKDFETYAKALIKAKKTGNYKPVVSKKAKVRESIKENTRPKDDVQKNKNVYNNNTDIITIKTEKLSIVAPITKDADFEEMPAPTILPPKRKVKKEKESINVKATRGRDNSKSNRTTRSNASKPERNSDVVLQTTPIPFVNLSDSEEEKQPEPVRSTRTRTKKAEPSEESVSTSVRSTRTRTKNKLQLENESVAVSTNMNETESSRNEVTGYFNLENVNSKTTDLEKDIDVSDQPIRMTRTKTKAKPKRERSQSEEQHNKNNHKRSKSNTRSDNEEAPNVSGRTEYEDAVSEIETCKNATFILPSKPTENQRNEVTYRQILDETVILDHQNKAHPLSGNHISDILTDDESLEEAKTVSPQKSKKAKEVFSPYVRSPVKKKVEAFEKFNQHDATEVSSKANTSRVLREIEENRGNVKEKAKGFTPISSKTMYKNGPSSTTKIGKYFGSKSHFLNDSMSLVAKSTPLKGPAPLKPVSVDYREKEAKRQEREREVKRLEQMKQAAMAEKKKRYEEKMLKIQQQKETLEKEKLKALESQRLKEERYKLLLQQKEEKQKQMKEENEKKRLLAKQRAEEKRKEEEYQRMLAHQEKLKNEQLMKKKAEAEDLRKKALQSSTLPVYMVKPAPYLQCADCYDSDDEEYSSKRKIPDWASKYRKFEVDKTQTTLGHRIKNTFFCCQNHTVDLRDLFIQIDPRKLKRTSSANWKKPPRFTMLPDC